MDLSLKDGNQSLCGSLGAEADVLALNSLSGVLSVFSSLKSTLSWSSWSKVRYFWAYFIYHSASGTPLGNSQRFLSNTVFRFGVLRCIRLPFSFPSLILSIPPSFFLSRSRYTVCVSTRAWSGPSELSPCRENWLPGLYSESVSELVCWSRIRSPLSIHYNLKSQTDPSSAHIETLYGYEIRSVTNPRVYLNQPTKFPVQELKCNFKTVFLLFHYKWNIIRS